MYDSLSLVPDDRRLAPRFPLRTYMNQYVRDGKWRRHTAELHRYRGRVYRIAGCTMGIVGLGHVGKQVAPRAQGMKLNVQTYDPYLDPKIAQSMGVKMVAFDELVRTSDFISLHAPLTKQTRKMFSTPQFMPGNPMMSAFSWKTF